MYKYTKIRVNTLEEYVTAVEDGYYLIDHPNLTTEEIIKELEQYKDEDNDLALQYATLLSDLNNPEALTVLERMAKLNNPRALCQLGFAYSEGKLVEKSDETAFEYYLRAAELGERLSLNNVALCYKKGLGVEKNDEKSFYWFKKAAEQGVERALYLTGLNYMSGSGVKKDLEQAIIWFKKAIENNVVEAYYALTVCYYNNQAFEDAVYWAKKGAEKDNADCLVLLAKCYRLGKGVEQSYEQAFKCYLAAANLGSLEAQYGVANAYYYGEFVPQSYEKAFMWYERTAKKGYSYGLYACALMYASGRGVEKNLKMAYGLYQYLAEHGHLDSKWKMAECLYEGWGVERNYTEAAKLLQEAATAGQMDAQYFLGMMYIRGEGVEHSLELGYKWCMEAAKQGKLSAITKVGDFYFSGALGEKSLDRAREWFEKAAGKDDGYAFCQLGNVCLQKKEYEKAVEYYKQSIEAGYSGALVCLGDCYYLGYGVEPSQEIAFGYYRQAAEKNNPLALVVVGSMYCSGTGAEKSYDKAFEYISKAYEMDTNAPIAPIFLGTLYYNGLGVEKDYDKAFQLLQKADQNISMNHLSSENLMERKEIATIVASCYYLLGRCYYFEEGTKLNYDLAFANFRKAADISEADCRLLVLLAYCYEEGTGTSINLDLALLYFQKAYDGGATDVKEDIERVAQAIKEKAHNALKVPEYIDFFISWNNKNLTFKNQLCDALKAEDLKIWESDENAEGNLDLDVKYAINHAKGYIIMLSNEAFDSSYMPLEVEMMFDRIERDDLVDTVIKIYILGEPNEVINKLKNLPLDHAFRKLIPLTADFSFDEKTVVKFALRIKRQMVALHYQKQLYAAFDVFPISISDIITKQNNNEIKASLEFESGYINRYLLDNEGNKYVPSALLGMKDIVLIHGEGGSGKSLYIKNLIRTNSVKENIFFYLPCSEIKKEMEENGHRDLISLISIVSFKIANCQDISLNTLNDIFKNEDRNFYIIFDALDEADEYKKEIIKYVHAFDSFEKKNHIHFIFTSRNNADASLIEATSNHNVKTLLLNQMNDDDIMALFDSVFQRNFGKEKATSALGLSAKKPDRQLFVDSLKTITDDIKKNPLLISNLIYIYFATSELQTQKSYLLETSSDILVNSLEEERGTSKKRKEILKTLKISLNDLLEYIAFKIAVNSGITLESAISAFLKKTNDSEEVSALSSYLRNRRIIIGNNFSHSIYLSFYAAKYMYNRVYITYQDDDYGRDYVGFKEEGTEVLDKYNDMFFSKDSHLWPSITLDFVGKLDYEIHEVEKERTFFDDMSPSYATFDCSLKEIIDSMSIIAYHTLENIVNKGNLFYWNDFIKDYLNRE